MDTKKIEPLLSDEHRDASCPYNHVASATADAWIWGFDHCRHLYEADRQKTRAVVQALVNGINDARFALWAAGKTELANQLAEIELRAKNELNITTTRP